MNLKSRALKTDSHQKADALGAAILAALVVMITSGASSAMADTGNAAADLSNFSAEIYSQSMYRADERGDRPHGLFHETRVRGSFGSEDTDGLQLDIGSYFLAEWSEPSAISTATTNTAASPFVGAHWRGSRAFGTNSNSSIVSLTLQFEGRFREPLSDFSRASGVRGWDPRTGAAFGVWHQVAASDPVGLPGTLFVDLYADLFYAPKYSSSALSTLIARLGDRFHFSDSSFGTWKPFADLYFEIFSQNATSLELGTKRTEGRVGVAVGALRESGSLQLRVFQGWPIQSDRDSRSRTEALLVGGFSL